MCTFNKLISNIHGFRQIQKILEDKTEAKDGEKYLAALTAGDRVPWAHTRKQYFSEGINRRSLDAIEKVFNLQNYLVL